MAQRHRKPIGRRSPGEGRKTFRALVGAASVACALGLFHTWTRIAVLDRSYQLGRARQDSQELTHELQALRLEVATLQATARVDREAQEKLQMHRPPPDRTVVLGPKEHGETAQRQTDAKSSALAVNAPVP